MSALSNEQLITDYPLWLANADLSGDESPQDLVASYLDGVHRGLNTVSDDAATVLLALPTFEVYLTRIIHTRVYVPAPTPEAARATVQQRTYPLPERHDWDGSDHFTYLVSTLAGEILLDSDDQ